LLSTYLIPLNASWTATCPVARHADHTRALQLMTFWRADRFHLNHLTNFHYSGDPTGRDVGDRICASDHVYATSNALIMDFSIVNSTGVTVDNSKKLLNVNTHLPVKAKIKPKCLELLFNFLRGYPRVEEYLVFVSGDMNYFADEKESAKQMLDEFQRWASRFGPVPNKDNVFTYPCLRCPAITRSTTFIPMLYDMKHNMKLIDPETDRFKWSVWCEGQADQIKKAFNGLEVGPLDWVLVRETIQKQHIWCLFEQAYVVTNSDLAGLDVGMREWTDEQIQRHPDKLVDIGNFLSDHMPVVSQFFYV
jgi:hypothetical protein